MTTYDASFLEANGYFGRRWTDTERVEGEDVAFTFDPDARLAYFDGVAVDRHQAVVSELRSVGRNVDFYWFWNEAEERVAVYNRYGEHEWFVFDQSTGLAPDARRSKEARLEDVDEGLESLFDVRAAVDRFYRNLWDIRLGIARALEPPDGVEIDDGARVVAAQRTIDRLIFCCFLAERDVVHGVDDAGNRFGLAPGELFGTALEGGDFYAFLTETFFDHLKADGWTEHQVTDGVAVAYPYLNGGLFRDHEVETVDGATVTERDLDAAGYDWGVLVDELDRYDWLVEDAPSEAAERRDADTLSPAVLGHIFERFVVTVSELEDGDELSLEELDEVDVSAGGDQLLRGNREVGAYYTPNYVAYENTRETLWNRVRTALADAHADVTAAEIPEPGTFFEEATGDGSPYPVGPDEVGAVLDGMTVLDPSVGSGAFLTTAGEVLETWRHRCTDGLDRHEIRRDIVCRSLYGVDLLDGAVEVCKLRLWLWLTGTMSVDLDDDEPTVETLPNIGVNVRQGNSLVGVAKPGCGSPVAHAEFDWTDGERRTYPEAVADYRENVLDYRVASGPEADALRDTVSAQRDVLRAEFTRMYARDSDVTVEDPVDTYEEFTAAVAGVEGAVKCTLDFDSEMTAEERAAVSDAGFREQRNWATTAYHTDVCTLPAATVQSVFELMDGRGDVSIERPVSPADVEATDPFHWIFEFPTAYAPTAADEAVAFDVVVGNPPHGSTVGALQRSLLSEEYDLVEGGGEVAKLFTERGWALTGHELSYVVPKASTYNSNWEDFRAYCLSKVHRGIDLGKAFRNVDHEQVTVHLSDGEAAGETYTCGPLPEGSYHLDDAATIERSFAERLGTLPVSFSAEQQAVVEGLAEADFQTLGDRGVDAGRGASTRNRVDDPSEPAGYNGRQVQRYFTRVATDRVDVEGLSDASRRRLEAPKVMAQNIVAHARNPYDHLVIAAAYDPVESYSFETVTNVLLPDDADLSLPALSVLLNTRFVNWFVYHAVFNRAIRDMHLDGYFLERVVLPRDVTETQRAVLEQLYGLLAVANVADEYAALPDGGAVYAELQSVANAVTYELYLAEVDTRPLTTDLAGAVAEVLAGQDVAFEDWYARHLDAESAAEVERLFREHDDLFETAVDVAAAVRRDDAVQAMDAIADHPWVETIERGRHRRGDGAPSFGPTTPE